MFRWSSGSLWNIFVRKTKRLRLHKGTGGPQILDYTVLVKITETSQLRFVSENYLFN